MMRGGIEMIIEPKRKPDEDDRDPQERERQEDLLHQLLLAKSPALKMLTLREAQEGQNGRGGK